jgi:iron complex outermembrane recepter protein
MAMKKCFYQWGAVVFCCLLAANTATSTEVNQEKTDEDTVSEDSKINRQVLTPKSGEIFMNIGEMVVTEKSGDKAKIDLPGSVDILGAEQLRSEVVSNSLELLRRIPGFVYSDYGNGGVPSGFTMRGFNSNHGSDNLVNIDGIPINDHFWQEDGAPDLNQLTSEEVECIEVIKGPIDARYGNWGRAGIVNVETRKRGDFIKTSTSAGSYGTYKAYVSGGSEHFEGKFNQIYSVEYFETEAWRDNSDQERQNAYGKWYVRPTDDLQIGLQTHIYRGDWSTGSYLPETMWKENPRQAFASSEDDGGNKDLHEASLHLDYDPSGTIPIEARLWYKENEASRFADWGSGQTETYTDENVFGMLANVGYNLDFSDSNKLRFDTGFDFRTFESDYQEWNTDARTRESLTSNYLYDFNNLGLYAKANYDPSKYIRLFTGIRHDYFTGERHNNLTGVENDMDDYDITTYKGGIIGNITERYSLYANIGTAFTLPKKGAKYDESHADVQDLLFTEVGLKASPFDWLMIRYAYFYSEEDVQSFIAGEYISEGDAIRKGHEVEANVWLNEGLEVFSSLTLDNSKFDGGENDGNWVTTVPQYIWKVGIQYDAPFKTKFRIWYTDVGKWYTDASNEHSYDGFQTTDLTISHLLADKWTIALDVKNILDEEYAEFVSYWSGENQYMPSNPRTFFLTLRYNM